MLSAALYAHVRTPSTIAHETAGAARTRHSLRPLIFRGRKLLLTTRAVSRRGIAELHLPSLRAKRSNPSHRVKKEWIASSQALLAMTTDAPSMANARSRSRRAIAPEPLKNLSPSKTEGAGNAGCALHPRSRAQRNSGLRARAYRAAEAIRHSLRNGFTAYNALSPVSRSSLATVAPEKLISPELDASISGVRTTRLCRTLSCRSLSALPASTATRPTIVAIMIRPSGRDGMDVM